MALKIESGLGDGRVAGVSPENRLMVAASTNIKGHFISRDDNLAVNPVSHDATAAAGTHVFYFKNDSATRDFFVDLMRVGGVASILWKVWSVTGTAADGSALTPVNLNLKSGATAEATARGGDAITGLTQVDEIATVRSAANANTDIPFDDMLILGQGDAIAVEADAVSSTDVAEVLMRGYYEVR